MLAFLPSLLKLGLVEPQKLQLSQGQLSLWALQQLKVFVLMINQCKNSIKRFLLSSPSLILKSTANDLWHLPSSQFPMHDHNKPKTE